ncbi:MAG TPA: hypothetical protein VJR70_09635 [Stellaceae bacterium]|nr:hypothetical protein [Stellaceae bacterium]
MRSAARRLPFELAWERLVPSGPLIVFVLVFARLLATPLALLNDPDTYLHIAAGRWMLAHRALPLHDPFSHSMAGAAWLPGEWLAQIALAVVYDAAGWGGVILITAATVALGVALLAHFLLSRLDPLPALIAAGAAAALLLPHTLARPHALALPLLVLWSGSVLAARDEGSGPPFRVLPTMVLWANLHASFMFGLALAAFLAAEAVLSPAPGRTRRAEALRWGPFAAAALAAALVTPFGTAGLVQPIRLVGMPALQTGFIEWLSPDFHHAPALELWLLGVLFVGFASGVRLPAMRLVLLLGLVHMALQHVRHADLLAVVAPLAVAAALGRRLTELGPPVEASPILRWSLRLAGPSALPAVALSAALGVLMALPLMLRPVIRGDDAATPGAALAAAQRLGLGGPVFNSESFGGYLAFRGVPTFIDGRIEMYGNDFLARDIKAERGDEASLEAILSRHHIAWALLLPDSGAARLMRHLPGWRPAYADAHAVVFRRGGD